MSLFSGPEEHAANPPSTWQVVKVADRVWHLTVNGATMDSFTTKRDADKAKAGPSFWTRQYAKDGAWYAGETPPGHRSWADCKAEQDRMAAWAEQPHSTWVDEIPNVGDHGAWQAFCRCGWSGREVRIDNYTEHPDPSDAAHGVAAERARAHEEDGPTTHQQ